jgi:hypothetical protein
MIPIEQLKAALRIPSSRQSEDDYLAELEQEAVARVSQHTGRYYGSADETTEYVDGTDGAFIWLKEEPIVSDAITMTVTERWGVADTGTVIDADDDDGYIVRGRKLYRKNGVWTRGYEYEITYTRGYTAGEEPADIRKKVIGLVVLWYTTRIATPERDAAERSLLGAPAPRV